MRGEGSTATADSARPRAILFLSLTLLLYNLAAFVRQDSFLAPPAFSPKAILATPATGVAKGAMTLRQKFLTGLRVHVNRGTMAQISELPGISDKVARAVLDERNRIGRFKKPEELLEVRGIKEKRLQKILPFLTGFDNN